MDDELTIDLPLWDDKESFKLLQTLCAKHEIPEDAFRELVAIVSKHQHRERARGISDEFDVVFERIK